MVEVQSTINTLWKNDKNNISPGFSEIRITREANKKPIKILPASPINTLGFGKLNKRNPAAPPETDIEISDTLFKFKIKSE